MPPWEKYQSESASSEGPWSKYGGSATAEPTQVTEQQPIGTRLLDKPSTVRDMALGSFGGRALLGVGGPALAAMQAIGGEKGRKIVSDIEASKQRGMKLHDNEGFDWAGLAGSMVPGAGITKGVTAALPAATGAIGRIGTGAAIGAATSAAQPTAPSDNFWTDTAKKIGLGGLVGGAIPAVGEVVKGIRGGASQLNPTTTQTLAEGQKAGYVVSPSKVNPSFLNERLESIAGKAAVGQDVSKRNQNITNALVAKELGIPKGTSLTEDSLAKSRENAGKIYDEVAKLKPPDNMDWFPRFHEKDLFQQLKSARADANLAYKSNAVTPHPDMLARAEALTAKADSIDHDIAAIAKANGKDELVKELAKARTQFAKSYEYERALNIGDENISAPKIGALLNKEGLTGKSGATVTIGKMQQAFPQAMREGSKVPVAGVSGTDAGMSAMLGVGGGLAAGPAGILAAALPLLRGPARNLVLSPAYQKFATSDPEKFRAIVDSLARQSAGAAGTIAGRQ